MTDASETIWAVHWNTEGAVLNGAWADTIRHFGCGVEYRRADLPLTTEQIMADPRVKSLVEALEQISDQHVPDQPAADGADEVDYIRKHHLNLRLIARAALAAIKETKE